MIRRDALLPPAPRVVGLVVRAILIVVGMIRHEIGGGEVELLAVHPHGEIRVRVVRIGILNIRRYYLTK